MRQNKKINKQKIIFKSLQSSSARQLKRVKQSNMWSIATLVPAAVLILFGGVHAGNLTEETCKCWEGYEPQLFQDGEVACIGWLLPTLMECNVPEPPRCVCSGEVTGILTDSSGTWCSIYSKGEEIKRWACENKEDWRRYNKEKQSIG